METNSLDLVDIERSAEAMSKAMSEWSTEFMSVLARFAEAMSKVMADQFSEINRRCRLLYDTIYDTYLDQGAPYGETHEGFMRWMHERAEVNRLRTEADQIEQHHQDIADFRRLVARRNNQKAK